MLSLLNVQFNVQYNPTNTNKIKFEKETLINVEKLYNNRDNIIEEFENGVFPFKV